jgi:hypothetical protein
MSEQFSLHCRDTQRDLCYIIDVLWLAVSVYRTMQSTGAGELIQIQQLQSCVLLRLPIL